ncbi:MAG: response regulator [Sediminimonas sp.]|uniref:response regulator n=1 Tax=Sediminimonas sp. TaxID=2823379 RepID=UPI00286FBE0A|nr:response regulator [Sediminimonas sp.]MDR9485936.1 response regulator [Sediminimonas sp.]
MTFRILHVDDDVLFCEFVQAIFTEEEGYEVVSRQSADDALASVEDLQPDVIIVDIMMPTTGGLVLVQELRQIPATAQTPVILLSARSGHLEQYDSFREIASVRLTKPIQPDVLRSEVKAIRAKGGTGDRQGP